MNHADRRSFLRGLGALGAAGALPLWARHTLAQQAEAEDRILVIFELSGGNDGLNCVVPHGDDAYYRHRPGIGIPASALLPVDDHFGFNPGMAGFKRLWDRGDLALFHGCGYDAPSFSHFTSMAYYHTAAPNSGEALGWVGRLADAVAPEAPSNFLVNVDATQSLAVKSARHTPVVFDDPRTFQRRGSAAEQDVLARVGGGDVNPEAGGASNTRAYLREVARSGRDAAQRVRDAWSRYNTPVDYGLTALDLDKIAACIAAGLPTRLYYTSFRNNAFDTHVQQAALHRRLLTYATDAIAAFLDDMERLGVADRVLLLAFSEFGRRVGENANRGTDHGTANVMFLAGRRVRGGHYGESPDLERLDDSDNLLPTTDFRRVYATAIDGWFAPGSADTVLRGSYPAFDALI
ncbi:MAG: DUF1501 domain-containing protein [Pseudomonadota bacterium]